MKQPDETRRHFYVDESGDATFFDRRKKLVIGKEGCSQHLMLGYVRTEEPQLVRRALAELRGRLAEDPLFNQIPSFKKTARMFHAKDDSPEVRAEVFKLLRTLPVKAQFIFARKRVSTFRSAFRSRESEFYDHLVQHLFKRSLHLATENRICFATRGSKSRQAPLTPGCGASLEPVSSRSWP